MNKKSGVMLLFSLVLVPLFAYSVQGSNVINDLFETLFGEGTDRLDIPNLYDQYANIIDFALLAILFIAVANFALKDRFKTRAVPIVVGIILALGATTWMASQGMNLGMLGPIATAIVLGLVGVAIFYLIIKLFSAEDESKKVAAAVAYVLIYLAMKSTSPGMFDWLEESADIIALILEILFIVAIIYAGIGIYRLIRSIFRGGPKTGAEKELEAAKRSEKDAKDALSKAESEEEKAKAKKELEEAEQRKKAAEANAIEEAKKRQEAAERAKKEAEERARRAGAPEAEAKKAGEAAKKAVEKGVPPEAAVKQAEKKGKVERGDSERLRRAIQGMKLPNPEVIPASLDSFANALIHHPGAIGLDKKGTEKAVRYNKTARDTIAALPQSPAKENLTQMINNADRLLQTVIGTAQNVFPIINNEELRKKAAGVKKENIIKAAVFNDAALRDMVKNLRYAYAEYLGVMARIKLDLANALKGLR